jgi:hypothetical protein
MSTPTAEIAAQAAALIVEEGLDYATAKHKALRQMELGPRMALPGNEAIESCVREYLRLYRSDTQPRELQLLRELALEWMRRLQQWQMGIQVFLTGAVWHGTATRLNDIHLHVFCDDQKMLQIELLNHGLDPQVDVVRVRGIDRVRLLLAVNSAPLGQPVQIVLTLSDLDELRGALHPDGSGRSPMGSETAVSDLLTENKEIS